MSNYKENLEAVIAEALVKSRESNESTETLTAELVANVLTAIKDDPKLVATTLYFVGVTPEEAMGGGEFDSLEEAESYAVDQEEESNIYSAGAIINFHHLGLVG